MLAHCFCLSIYGVFVVLFTHVEGESWIRISFLGLGFILETGLSVNVGEVGVCIWREVQAAA